MAYRSLLRLQELCERLEAEDDARGYGEVLNDPIVDPSVQLASDAWNRNQSFIVTVAELEGGVIPKAETTQSSA
jgi:hypothetical protein